MFVHHQQHCNFPSAVLEDEWSLIETPRGQAALREGKKMFRKRVLFAAALCVVLGFPAPLAAEIKQYAYQPHYLASVEDASNQLKFFSPRFSPMEITHNGTVFGLTSGYSLERVDVNRLGINLSFTKSGVDQSVQYFWSWWGGYAAPVSTPYKDDIVTSIIYADVKFFDILNIVHAKEPAPWCVLPNGDPVSKGSICVGTEKEAQGLIDAVATLVVASGGSLEPSPGIWMKAAPSKESQNNPEHACKISGVEAEGPPAQAGIQVGDVIRSVNGQPCTGMNDYVDIVKKAVLGNGDVHVEILHRGQSMALDLHYPNPEVGAAQLRQQSAGSARHPVGSVISVPEVNQAALLTPATATTAPASGVRFGFQVRAVTDADVIPFGLVKPKGIVVVDVLKDGLADKMGFQPGDVILEVNDSEIGDLAFFTQFIHSGVVKNFRVWRKGQSLDLAMPQDM